MNFTFLLRDNQSARRDFNLGPPEFEAGWVTVGPQLSVKRVLMSSFYVGFSRLFQFRENR